MISFATRQSYIAIGTACALLLFGAAPVAGADIDIKPSLSISEEYTDNVFDSHVHIRSDYITRARPGVSLKYTAPFWDWDLGYAFDYRYYARGSRHGDTTHNINGRGLIKIVDEVLFLELSDVYQRVSLDVRRDTTVESLFANQSDRNVGIVSPYLVLRPTSRLSLKTGYRYINTWYEEGSAISRRDHIGFFTGSYDLTPRLVLTGDYTFTSETATENSSFHRHEAYVGPRYEYAENSFIHARGGFIETDYDHGPNLFKPSWNAGISHTYDTVIVTATTGRSYSDDPLGTSTLETFYSASLTKTVPRGSLTLHGSHTEFSDAKAGRLEDKRNSVGFAGTHELVQDLRATLGLNYEQHRDLLLNGTTDRYVLNCGVTYNFGRELTAAFSYLYTDYSSAEIAADNREVNRVILEVRKVF